MSTMRAVVVGGGGFLGSHVVFELLSRLGPSSVELLVAGRTLPAAPIPGTFAQGDRNDPAFIDELMHWRPDWWLDMAVFEPGAMEGVISAWRKHPGVKLFTFVGSIAEYGLGHDLQIPISEDQALAGEGEYATGKIEAWKAAATAFRKRRFPVFWAVLPQLWGPGDPHGRDAAYVSAIVRGEPVLLRGNGRTLVPDGYIGTVAAAMVHMGLNPASAGKRANISGFQVLTPLAFVRWSAEALGRAPRVVHVPHDELARAEQASGRRFRPVFGDYDLALDLTRLNESGFVQSIHAREGVARTALWHAKHGSVPDERFLACNPDLLSHCRTRVMSCEL